MSMNDHVNSFNKILADLLNLDEKFEDKDNGNTAGESISAGCCANFNVLASVRIYCSID